MYAIGHHESVLMSFSTVRWDKTFTMCDSYEIRFSNLNISSACGQITNRFHCRAYHVRTLKIDSMLVGFAEPFLRNFYSRTPLCVVHLVCTTDNPLVQGVRSTFQVEVVNMKWRTKKSYKDRIWILWCSICQWYNPMYTERQFYLDYTTKKYLQV